MESLRIGQVMRRSLGVTGELFLPLLMLALLAHAPHLAMLLLGDIDAALRLQEGVEFQLLAMMLAQLLGAAVAYATVYQIKGTRVGLLQTLHVVASRMFPIVAVGLVSQLTIVLMNIEPIFSLLGVLVTTILFVAVPIVVVEQPGIVESLRRSARLTSGRRWSILALLGVFVVIAMIVDQILQLIFGAQGEVLDPGYVIALSIFRAGLAVLGSVVAAVTYGELRRMHAAAVRRGL